MICESARGKVIIVGWGERENLFLPPPMLLKINGIRPIRPTDGDTTELHKPSVTNNIA